MRPIDTRPLGEVIVNQFEVREYSPGALLVICSFCEPDGDVYERVRMVMPASSVQWLAPSSSPTLPGYEFPPPHRQ